MFAGRLARGAGVVEVSEAALVSSRQVDTLRPTELLLHGLAVRFTEGYAAAAPILKEALDAFRRDAALPRRRCTGSGSPGGSPRSSGTTRHGMCSPRGSSSSSGPPARSQPSRLRSARAYRFCSKPPESWQRPHRCSANASGQRGDWDRHAPVRCALDAALRGRAEEASELISTIVSEAEARGEGFALATPSTRAESCSTGSAATTRRWRRVRQLGKRPSEIGAPTWALAELVEAATRCRQLEPGRACA